MERAPLQACDIGSPVLQACPVRRFDRPKDNIACGGDAPCGYFEWERSLVITQRDVLVIHIVPP